MRSQAEKLGLRSGKVVTISYRAVLKDGELITRRKKTRYGNCIISVRFYCFGWQYGNKFSLSPNIRQ